MIGRRGFLRLLGAAAAGFALDPDLALWVPGRVTTFDLGAMPHFVPEYGGAFFSGRIDGILKEVYMPFIMEQLNHQFVLDGRGAPHNADLPGVPDDDLVPV